jgi:hypothetical protein
MSTPAHVPCATQPCARVDVNPMPESNLSYSQGLRISWVSRLNSGTERCPHMWIHACNVDQKCIMVLVTRSGPYRIYIRQCMLRLVRSNTSESNKVSSMFWPRITCHFLVNLSMMQHTVVPPTPNPSPPQQGVRSKQSIHNPPTPLAGSLKVFLEGSGVLNR